MQKTLIQSYLFFNESIKEKISIMTTRLYTIFLLSFQMISTCKNDNIISVTLFCLIYRIIYIMLGSSINLLIDKLKV